MKVLMLGDIVGKIGRKGVTEALPKLKKKYKPDLVIANAENLAHGKGITEKTLQEMMDAGVDFFTSGNHIWSNKAEVDKILGENELPIIRPANYPPDVLGAGHKIVEVGVYKVLIVNLMGRVFFRENFDCPFRKLKEILEEYKNEKLSAVIVDLHAEATSEKNSLPRYFDGKVSAVFGTHTHVQTSDEQILEKGTAFITDVGMVGLKNSSLGVDLDNVIKNFLDQTPQAHEIPEHGTCQIDGVFAIIEPETSLATKIERIKLDVEV
ncbi:TIGR00282 family metallophosphoesterase [Candidatus Kuenenbacteria bacterium]|nr:TIGR00282 family metallophosphoesterase [Candidatus Kuenenbacteria bacterium]